MPSHPSNQNPFKAGDRVSYMGRGGKLPIPATVVRPAGSRNVSLRFDLPTVINSGRPTLASVVGISQIKRLGDGQAAR